MFRDTAIAILAAAAVVSSSPAEAKRVWDITYGGGGKIIQYNDDRLLSPGKTRLCLKNGTGQPKRVKWKQVRPANPITMLVPENGDQSCVTLPSDQTVSFDFQDRGVSVSPGQIDLRNVDGDIILFHWVADTTISDPLEAAAQQALKDLKPLLDVGVVAARCMSNADSIESVLRGQAPGQVLQMPGVLRCLQPIRQAAQRNGYNTITIGAGASVQAGVGGSTEGGIAIDVTDRYAPVAYWTNGYSVGWGAAVSGDVTIGFHKPKINGIAGDAQGYSYSGVALGGGGASVWYDYDGRQIGASATASVGVGGEVGVYHRVNTMITADTVPGTPPAGGGGRATGSPVTIQTIPLEGPYGRGIVVHSKIDSTFGIAPITRICLKNSTPHPKTIQHGQQGTNPLSAATQGSESCANFPSNIRLEFVFLDRGARVKGSAMNLSAYSGDTVTFDWRDVGSAAHTVNRGQITFYEHCGYQGRSVSIPNGRHTLASLRALGVKNDDISSIRVTPGNVVAVYQHDSFGGRRLDFRRDVACLVDQGFNDLLSSAIVWRE